MGAQATHLCKHPTKQIDQPVGYRLLNSTVPSDCSAVRRGHYTDRFKLKRLSAPVDARFVNLVKQAMNGDSPPSLPKDVMYGVPHVHTGNYGTSSAFVHQYRRGR